MTAIPPNRAPKVRFYRNIVATFVALNIVLLAFVVYLSFVKATITITPKNIPVSSSFVADVVAKPEQSAEVPGIVFAKDFEKTKEFQVAGGADIPGKSRGKVLLTNKTGNNQTLVKTTRVLSKEGVLFRLTNQVIVPARGTLLASVEADAEGVAGDIAATTFTIPGLPPSLQKEIYAESKDAFTGGVKHVATVKQEDLDKAMDELSKEVSAEAAEAMKKDVNPDFTGKSMFTSLVEKRSDTTPGTATDRFTVSAKMKVVGVFYDRAKLIELAKAKLFASLSDDLTLRQVDEQNLTASVDKYDVAKSIANLKVSASGIAHLKEGGALLQKDRLAGLGADEARAYIKGLDEVEDVKIEIRPFWVKTLPKLKDHIELKIVE